MVADTLIKRRRRGRLLHAMTVCRQCRYNRIADSGETYQNGRCSKTAFVILLKRRVFINAVIAGVYVAVNVTISGLNNFSCFFVVDKYNDNSKIKIARSADEKTKEADSCNCEKVNIPGPLARSKKI